MGPIVRYRLPIGFGSSVVCADSLLGFRRPVLPQTWHVPPKAYSSFVPGLLYASVYGVDQAMLKGTI